MILQARGLAVRRGKRESLAPCDVDLVAGEILGLFGPNGAGKSTLVQALAWLHPRISGELRFGGRVVGADLPVLEYRRRTAVVFQDVLLLRGTVLDNVMLGLKLRGVRRVEREARARNWLERLHVAHLAARPARGISSGEAQRVSLARAFALEPEVLFLDEPFAAVDAPTRRRLVDELCDVLVESGAAAVFVTHDSEELVDMCDRAMILDSGHVLQEGPAHDVFRLPRTRRVAEIIGTENLATATLRVSDGECSELDWHGETLVVPRIDAPIGTTVTVLIPPDSIDVQRPPAAVDWALVGTIVRGRVRAGRFLISVRLRNGRTVRAIVDRADPPRDGETVMLVPRADGWLLVEPHEIRFVGRGTASFESGSGRNRA